MCYDRLKYFHRQSKNPNIFLELFERIDYFTLLPKAFGKKYNLIIKPIIKRYLSILCQYLIFMQ